MKRFGKAETRFQGKDYKLWHRHCSSVRTCGNSQTLVDFLEAEPPFNVVISFFAGSKDDLRDSLFRSRLRRAALSTGGERPRQVLRGMLVVNLL